MLQHLAVTLLAVTLVALPAWPQASTSTVNGTVRDQSGAVVPGAAVTLTNTGTNITARTTSNETGFYMLPGVLPGAYALTVEVGGMQKFEVRLTVQVQQTAVVDAVLRLGQTTTEVEVKDVTPMLTVDAPTLGHVLDRRRIDQLPLNGRFLDSPLQTIPGMEGRTSYGERDGSSEFVLDGAVLTNRNDNFMRRPPGLDTIQEFKVENNSSSAKFTRPTTVVMSTRSGTNQLHGALFETHRNNAIGLARTRTDFYDKAPQLIRNEFGGSAGGPVVLPKLYNGANRTFWFFAYENYRNVNPSTKSFSVPTAAMRNGDFRELVDAQGRQYKLYDPWTTNSQTWQRQPMSYGGQLNVIDPARLSPLSKYLYSITPLPTRPEVNPLLDDNWWGPVPNRERQPTLTTRIDHHFSERDQFYARFTRGEQNTFKAFANGANGGLPVLDGVANTVQVTAPNMSLALSHVHTFSSTFFNEVLLSGARDTWLSATGGPVKYADQLGLPNPFGANGWPNLTGTGLIDYVSKSTTGHAMNFFVLDDNATKIHGKHEFQFGVHIRYDQLNLLPDQQNIQGGHDFGTQATSLYDPASTRTNPQATPQTGNNAANMYLGVMNYAIRLARGYFYTRAHEYATHFQDNYKVSSRLTLNLGLRWELWPAFREKNNVLTGWDPERRAIVLGTDLDTMYRLGATLPSVVNRLQALGAKFESYQDAGMPRSLMTSNSANFGPRLGFAWRAGQGRSQVVVRGGYRVSYFAIPMRAWVAAMRASSPLTARFTKQLNNASQSPDGVANYLMRSVPSVIAGVNSRNVIQPGSGSESTRGSEKVLWFTPNQPDPRVQDWNLTLEKEVLPDTLVRAAYIGNHVDHLEQYSELNDPTPAYIWFMSTGQRMPTGEYAQVATRPYDQQTFGAYEQYVKSGWSNYNGMQFELERRYNKGFGFQLFYNIGNAMGAGGQDSVVLATNQFLPGIVPTDFDARNRLLNYQRDISIPKHRVRWNWIADLPIGKGKWLGRNANGFVDKLIGGWQLAGMGNLRSNYFALPTGAYPTGEPIQLYGYKYPIEDCRTGTCWPGYLWFNGYIPANRINSVDASGKPNGVMGVPADYKPAAQPLIPWPANPNKNDPMYAYYGTNTTWVTLKDGTVQRTTYDTGLHPWRQQYLPGVRQWVLNASLYKRIPINERLALRFNADFFNVLNHPGNPNSVDGAGVLNTRSSSNEARVLQLTLRLIW